MQTLKNENSKTPDERLKEDKQNTHFGFQTIPSAQKNDRVKAVFNSVSQKYDLMNDVMSFGLHRLWKRYAAAKLALRPKLRILDLASGTGDLSELYLKEIDKNGLIVVSDINLSMLNIARDRFINQGKLSPLCYLSANAENLPFSENSFDRISMGFGLRNVTHKDLALKEMYRVLKPGGRVVILEFSHPKPGILNTLYEKYSFSVIPWLGKMICEDTESYQYLVESIRMHPDQENLKNMMTEAGFEKVEYQNIHSGIIAIHTGYKF
jgi:demethylmenaquinone methyltransferase/2-methoxy-6-polyprenyl-1,4-benzoquinol methylase